MTRQQSTRTRGAVGPWPRALLSWITCLATILIALVVCSQSAPRVHDVRLPAASTVTAQLTHAPLADGCLDHAPGHQDHCVTALQHTPKSLAPAPDLDAPFPTPHRDAFADALPADGITRSTPALARAVDLHVLQVQRT